MLKKAIAIRSFASISPLGNEMEDIWAEYLKARTKLSFHANRWQGKIMPTDCLEYLNSDRRLKHIDFSVRLALYSSKKAVELSGWKSLNNCGVNFGSSRGATQKTEESISQFIEHKEVDLHTSPSTTLGNISTWISQTIGSNGINLSHSITCSTAMHSILNGVAWLQADLSDKFIVGGTEAPLTDYTFAQLDSLGIYTKAKKDCKFPVEASNFLKEDNTMALGEAAISFCLDKNLEIPADYYIKGIGYATESIKHAVAISHEGLRNSMEMALEKVDKSTIDIIVTHTPGTIKGDLMELKSIDEVFTKRPLLTNNKWICGHTFGASGALSLEMALIMLKKQFFIATPFGKEKSHPKKITNILVNAIGFGGNAVSILVSNK